MKPHIRPYNLVDCLKAPCALDSWPPKNRLMHWRGHAHGKHSPFQSSFLSLTSYISVCALNPLLNPSVEPSNFHPMHSLWAVMKMTTSWMHNLSSAYQKLKGVSSIHPCLCQVRTGIVTGIVGANTFDGTLLLNHQLRSWWNGGYYFYGDTLWQGRINQLQWPPRLKKWEITWHSGIPYSQLTVLIWFDDY